MIANKRKVEQIAFTVLDTSVMGGVHPNTVRRAIAKGDLRAIRIGKSIRIRREEIERWLGSATKMVAVS